MEYPGSHLASCTELPDHQQPGFCLPGRRVAESLRGIWLVQEEGLFLIDVGVFPNKWHSWITLQKSSLLPSINYRLLSLSFLNMSKYPGITRHLRKICSMNDKDQRKQGGQGSNPKETDHPRRIALK